MSAEPTTFAAIDRLEARLREVNAAALAKLDPGDLSGLAAELPKLQVWAVSATGFETLDEERVVAAVREFRDSGILKGLGHARLVCYGCTRDVDGKKLIEEPARFAALIEYVDKYHNHPRPFRRCYRALLDAYFSFDPESASDQARQSWPLLRRFLDRRKSWLETPASDPEWVTALLENRNLLSEDPVTRYGMAALQENYAAFERIRARLGIPEDSWIARRLVLAQLNAATGLPDQHFKAVVVRLLVQLAKHPLILDAGLCRVIDRYAATAAKDLHARLRDFAVMHWGDPRVAANSPRWACLRPGGREMIAGWLNAAV